MENETLYLWNASLAARNAARAGNVPAAREAIDDLEGISLHGAPKAARGAYAALQGLAGHAETAIASYACAALERLQAA
jgi:hypothetical protein